MKRMLSLLLGGVLCLGLAACGETVPPATDPADVSSGLVSGTESESGTDFSTDTDGTSASSEGTVALQLFNPDLEHKVIMDDSSKGILVADLDLSGDSPEAWEIESSVIWEWSTDDAEGSGMEGKNINIDSAKYRYSPYYESDVIVFCGSGGWVGIIDYGTKELLFEDNPGLGPHSVELMPNGDLVLVCSGNSSSEEGGVLYYPLSAGETEYSSSIRLESAHGVCYDPEQKLLWVLGGYEIIAVRVSGEGTANAKISAVSGMGVSLKNLGHSGGHELSPVYGQPGKYWVSSSKQIWVFDSEKETLSATSYKAEKYTNSSVKGIAYFSDGTMIQTAHDQGGTGTYRSSQLRVMYLAESSGKVKASVVREIMIPHREGSQTYKINVFTKDYQ